ncbi:MAG: nucleoside triphosphate pyrophosphohydrolase [Verrucomicrobia bacterium]|nr:nucleoside triphosphate pyrophosphohydrolase [Verrucomicrobiota bacterium]
MNSDSIQRLREIVRRLRAPGGCPWDREQTHASLKPHLLEECYELLEAIDTGNNDHLREELGDLLLQVMLHAQIAAEEGRFSLDDIAGELADKLVRRHPHVFGENRLPDSDAVLRQWDQLKQEEKVERRSALDGVPPHLPALARAQKVQAKAARIGFDWPDAAGALAKVQEELAEVAGATAAELEGEVSDLLFAVVNYARKRKVDAEQALLSATRKFSRRFHAVEGLARARGLDARSLRLDQLDALWDEVKARDEARGIGEGEPGAG